MEQLYFFLDIIGFGICLRENFSTAKSSKWSMFSNMAARWSNLGYAGWGWKYSFGWDGGMG